MADDTPDTAGAEDEAAAEAADASVGPEAGDGEAGEASPSDEQEAAYEPRVLYDDFARCLAPIEGDDPCGENPRHDEDAIDLKSEVEKIPAGRADWKVIKELAVKILATKAKDLYAASYLTAALVKRDGFPGLLDGLTIVRHLVEKEWEDVHPRKPPRSRAFALDWLVTRVHPHVESCEPVGDECQCLQPALDHVLAIAGLAAEKLEKLAPSFDDLSKALKTKIDELEPPEPPPQEAPAPDSQPAADGAAPTAPAAPKKPAAAAAPAPAPARPVAMSAATPLPEDASSSEIRDRLRALVAPMRQSSQFSPMSYRLLRVLKWDDLPGLPPTDPGTVKTKVPGPRAQLRAALENLYGARQWPQLLEASEAAFQDGSGTFWLDLQLYTSTSLEQLDSGRGLRAAGMVRDELAKVLERFEKLPQLTFADGSPFASPETRQWIDGVVIPMDVDVGGGGGRAEDVVLTPDEVEEAKTLFSRQEAAAAMELLQAGLGRATNRRGAFRTRLTTAQLCLHGNRVEWAKALLEELAREIETLRFEHWEPETAVEVYHLLTLCLGRQLQTAEALKEESRDRGKEAALRSAISELESKLFRLDLRAVAKIDQTLKKD